MITALIPRLPMRDKALTRAYYRDLGFTAFGAADFPDYLMVGRDGFQLHFFLFPDLNPEENDGQVYLRTEHVDALYAEMQRSGRPIHPNGQLQTKPWGQREFAMLDPDNNLLTFGQTIR